jgi:UTP--glucose-1-phosphate uridylyltransferase
MTGHVTEAVVPAAGLGTRFLPATLTVPKEMLPLLTRPAIHLIMEELRRGGIERVILVISSRKETLRRYLTLDGQLGAQLARAGREDLKEEIEGFSSAMHIEFVHQDEPLGLGHAVGLAEKHIEGHAFFVVLPDWLFLTREPAVRMMRREYERDRKMIISTMPVPDREISSYGILEGPFISDRAFKVEKIVEKPAPAALSSNLAISGRYILPGEIFEALKKTPPGRGGEIQLTDAIAGLKAAGRPLFGLNFPGGVYDLGTVGGWLQANQALLDAQAAR